MVDAGLDGLLVGVVAFLVLAGFCEQREHQTLPRIARASFLLALLLQLIDSIVVDGTWDLVSVSTPDWLGLSSAAVSASLLALPGYIVWRWNPQPSETLDTEAEQRFYRPRRWWIGLSLVVGIAYLFVFGLFVADLVRVL